jgi:hypothetical protein
MAHKVHLLCLEASRLLVVVLATVGQALRTLVVAVVLVVVVGLIVVLLVQETHQAQHHHKETMVVLVCLAVWHMQLVAVVVLVQSVLPQRQVVWVLLAVQVWLHLSQVHQ